MTMATGMQKSHVKRREKVTDEVCPQMPADEPDDAEETRERNQDRHLMRKPQQRI